MNGNTSNEPMLQQPDASDHKAAADWDDIARRIHVAHDFAGAAARSAIEHAIECGRLLIEAKTSLPHGKWLGWLEANTVVSARQSQKYMRLAEGVETGKCEVDAHLTIDGAMKLLAAPTEEASSGDWLDALVKNAPAACRWN